MTTFNLGIGYCLVVPDEVEFETRQLIDKNNFKSWIIGEITAI